MEKDNLIFHKVDGLTELALPLSEAGVAAGFPSMADDFIDLSLDLNKELIKNPSSTFFARVKGVSMINDGVDDGDLLLIDKSVEAYSGALVVAYLDGEFTLKRFEDKGDYALLVPANKSYEPIRVTADNDFRVWGVVRYLIKKM